MPKHTVKMDGETLNLFFSNYMENGNVALSLYDQDNVPYMTASVNPGFLVPKTHIAIKNYSENTGILDVLVAHGIVEDEGETVAINDFCEVNICKLLVNVE